MTNSWIQTSSGKAFDVMNPSKDTICVYDIAEGLSRTCRFSGQLRSDVQFYSVAQHCVLVSRLVPPGLALHGLMHDSPEAYLGDVTSPTKRLLSEYRVLEGMALNEIAKHLGIDVFQFSRPEIHHADLVALATERRDLLGPAPKPWFDMPEPDTDVIRPMLPFEARALFVARLNELGLGK